MIKRTVTAAALAAFPTSARADDLLDRLARTDWPQATQCSMTLRVVSAEDGEPVARAYRFDSTAKTTTMIEGPPEEMAAQSKGIAGEADGQADAKEDRPPDEDEEGGDEEGVNVSLGFTPYEAAARTEGFEYIRQPDAGDLAVYRSSEMPKDTFQMSGRDFSKRSAATIYVDDRGARPFVVRRVLKLEKPMRIPLLAKVADLRSENAYALVGGAPVPVLMAFDYDADAFGAVHKGRITMTQTDHDCPVPGVPAD